MSVLQRLSPFGQRNRRPPCPSCGKGLARSYKFCPECGHPVAAYLAVQGAAASLEATAKPFIEAVATVSASGPSLQVVGLETDRLAEERRLVTVMFADLSGSTALGEQLDPEELRRILTSFFSTLSRQIQRFGGTVDKYIGDAVMAVFGAPVAHEDDPERAIRAALAMQSAIARLNDDLERQHGVRLSLRIGVNTGEVVAGLLAGEVQGAYTVVGDTVNMAQRLESVAPPGQILVGVLTAQLSKHAFELEELAPVTVKGKSEPVLVYQVIRPLDDQPVSESSGLLGRTEELSALRDALHRTIDNEGQLVALRGDAGVGKSRLVREFNLSLSVGIHRLSARCASFDEGTPYALLADLLRNAFGIPNGTEEGVARAALSQGMNNLGREPDELHVALLLDVLGYPAPSSFDPESKRRVLINLVRRLLERQCEHAPLVVLLEDLHWLDSASASVLDELVPGLSSLACLVIATGRPDWEPAWACQRLDLRPLGASEARELVLESIGGEVESAVVDAILAKTSGNPFFTQEVTRSLRETGVIVQQDGIWRAAGPIEPAVPATVHEVLAARLDRLPTGTRRTLQTASVMGRTFWHRVMQHVAASPTLTAELEALEAKGFLELRAATPERTYSFRHALIQEVAYGTILQAQRRVAHGTVAAAMEKLFADRTDEFVDELAFHYGRSDRDEKALHWLVRGADRAKGLYANQEALTLYASALERASHVDGSVDAAEILECIGDVKTVVGRYDDALEDFRVAHDRNSVHPLRAARLHRKKGTALALKGVYPQALEELASGLQPPESRPEPEQARIRVRMGEIHGRTGNYLLAKELLEQAIDIASAVGADEVVAEGLRFLGSACTFTGELQRSAEAHENCIAICERLGDLAGSAGAHNNTGLLYRRLGRWDDALTEFSTARDLYERVGNPWGIALALNNFGEIHLVRGDYERARGNGAQARRDLEQAVEYRERARQLWMSIGAESDAQMAVVGMGLARARLGEADRARTELLAAQAHFEAVGKSRYRGTIYRNLVAAELAAGDLNAAQAAAERAMEYATASEAPTYQAMTQRLLAEIALARGDQQTAHRYLEASRDCLTQLGETGELLRTEALLATLPDFVPA
jgi:adenylate cyclase